MSLVGPRPIRPRFFEELALELPAYWQRLVVRPGLTGFAQVRKGYETSMAEKLAHDLEYIADRSVRLYLRTLVTTGWRVLLQSLRGLLDPLVRSGVSARATHAPETHQGRPSKSRRSSSRSMSRSTRCMTSSLIQPSLRSRMTARRSASSSSRRSRW